jgi:hypothetical protein
MPAASTLRERRRPLISRPITSPVTHPAAPRVKRPVRNLMWWAKGLAMRNPALPSRVRSVLFVCLGNICRSPFAAALAARRVTQAGVLDVRCASGGSLLGSPGRHPVFDREGRNDQNIPLPKRTCRLQPR